MTANTSSVSVTWSRAGWPPQEPPTAAALVPAAPLPPAPGHLVASAALPLPA